MGFKIISKKEYENLIRELESIHNSSLISRSNHEKKLRKLRESRDAIVKGSKQLKKNEIIQILKDWSI